MSYHTYRILRIWILVVGVALLIFMAGFGVSHA